MKYQLVLQWPFESSTLDYQRLVEIESLLMEELSSESKVDGHDAGSEEMNIFIFTNDPLLSFQQVRAILEGREAWANIRAAYHDVTGEKYTILWPKHLSRFKVA